MIIVAEDQLKDLLEIQVDQSLDKTERIKQYIKDIGNPYNFKVGGVEVAVTFDSEGETLQKKMEKYFESMII